MYQGYRTALVVLLLATGAGAAENESDKQTRSQGIEWINHYGQARRLSHQTNRPVLLFLSTESCIHCARMENGAFCDRRIVQRLQHEFIPAAIKITGESSLARDLQVTIYPTTVIIAPDGRILDYVRGYISPEELSPRLANAVRTSATAVASREER